MADIRKKHESAWLVRWRENGKQKYRQFKTESEAEEFKKTVEPDRFLDETKRRGQYQDPFGKTDRFGRPKDTPEASEERWSVVGYAKRMIDAEDLSSGTRATYHRALRRYFEGTDLGRADVRYVTPDEITTWWNGVKTGRADAQRLLSKVFLRAVRLSHREDNPLLRTDIHKPKPRELDFDPLTADQIEDLADAATKATKVNDMIRQRDRLLILTMGFAGLRAGETGGLRLQDLIKTPDGKCQIRVRQQIVRNEKERPHVAPLKTGASRRTITVACSLWDELKAFAAKYEPAEDGRIFRGPNGEMRDNVLIRNTVTAAAKRAGMAGVHPHLLRHSAISILIHHGANARQIQAFAGHADISMTLGTYGHLFDDSGTELANIMETLRERRRNGGK